MCWRASGRPLERRHRPPAHSCDPAAARPELTPPLRGFCAHGRARPARRSMRCLRGRGRHF
eukprot:6129190-Lingulodinium_polyedra.AAC.1